MISSCVSALLLVASVNSSLAEGTQVGASPAPDTSRDASAGSRRPDRDEFLQAFRPEVYEESASPLAPPVKDTPKPQAEAPASTIAKVSPKPNRRRASKSGFVPPGFEDLLEPQTTIVDVFWGGAYLTSTSATFTPSDIAFESPQDITGRIPDILEPEVIAAILATDMPTNSEFGCLTPIQEECGQLATQTVDVIFDEGRFRADLFIAPSLLTVRTARIDKYLPRSDAGLSLLNVTSAAVNRQQLTRTNFNIGNSTTIAYKESRLFAVSNYTATDKFTVDTLALQREINGQLIQAGYFRSNAGSLVFLPQSDFAGLSIASSLDTRQDLDQSTGNELQVFLPTRSRVDLLKDDRLISTAMYDTGNQIIDTSQLPGGAYDIVLRIRDNLGKVREETRFYVKSNRLPPLGETQYFIDLGELVERQGGEALPGRTGERLFRAGISRRLTSDFGGELGLLKNKDDMLFELGMFKLGRSYDVRISYVYADDSSSGASIVGRQRIGPTTVSGSVRKIQADNALAAAGIRSTQATLNLSLPLGRSSLNLTSRYNKRAARTDTNYGVRYEFPSFHIGNQPIEASLQVTRDNDDLLILLGMRLFQRSGQWQNQLSSRYFREKPETLPATSGIITNASTNWQDGERFLSDVSWTMRANDEQTDRSIESEFEIASDYGRATIEGNYSFESRQFNYGAGLNTIITAAPGVFTFGGRAQAQSAIVLDITGEAADAWFDVHINNMNRGNARIGRKTVIGLAPFETYEVVLQPRGSALVDFLSNTQSATLYPGNVVPLVWQTRKVLVAFGQVLDSNGNPLPNGIIEGVIGLATTDDFGLFQAEIASDTRTLSVRTRTSQCAIELPEFRTDQLLVTLGELSCR